MHMSRPSPYSLIFNSLTTLFHSLFRRGLRRRLVCLILIVNLLIWPGSHYAIRQLPMLASTAISLTMGPARYLSVFFKSIFTSAAAAPPRESLADRLRFVSQLQLSPRKHVGYAGQNIFFSAFPTDSSGRTLQGITYTWSSSSPDRVAIDHTGRARLLSPGLAWIICRAGSVEKRAPVLVRPGSRPRQTDQQWIDDQRSLREDGSIASGPGSTTSVAGLIPALLDKLAPTAHAQGSWFPDLFYDQMWSEPRNLVGSPSNVVTEPTRTGTVLPEGSNFRLAIPIQDLGGRGIGANVTLYYNSRVWSRRDTRVAFDPIAGWPGHGFTLGFGRVETYGYDPSTGNYKYVFIEPDGTRRYLGSGLYASGGTFETTDGSHIVYVGNGQSGGTIYYPDGTKVYIGVVNNRLLATSVSDTDGNFIQITYMPECIEEPGGIFCGVYPAVAIDYVTDTMGRVIDFKYDSGGKLVAIEKPGFSGNPTVKFDYHDLWPSYNFSGVTVERGPTSNRALRHIYFPTTGTGYLMNYSQYGMIYSFSARRQMSLGWPDVIQSGVESNNVTFNYPGTPSPPLTDAPAFTERTETATDSPTSTYGYSKSEDASAQTMTFTITQPDSSQLLLTRSTNSASPANGRLTQSEIRNSAGVTFSKAVYSYVDEGGGSPQVQSVTSYDDTNTPTKVDFDYDGYGNVVNKREYGHQIGGAWRVRRRTQYSYTYLGYIRNRVTWTEVFDAREDNDDANDTVIARTSFTLDDYAAMGGMEYYPGLPLPPGHNQYQGPARGNVTGVTEWTDIAADTSITRLRKYDKFGNVIKEQLSCCNERGYAFTETHFWSQTERLTSGTQSGHNLTSTAEYNFNTGTVRSVTDPNNLRTSYGYDAVLRPTSMTAPTGASAVTIYNDGQLTVTQRVTYDDGGVSKTITTSKVLDGWGREIRSVSEYGGQVNTTYDAMGRVVSRTNPFAQWEGPGPATTYQYDTLGRPTVTTLPGGDTVRTDYIGSKVTVTDQVGRKVERESDGLGRLVKVVEQDPSGGLTQQTTYSYNLQDKLTQVNQGGQIRSYKYDALGRLLFERIPEQTATINDGTGTYWTTKYTYTDFHAVSTRTDARGVVTTYGYDALNRLRTISYDTSGASGVAATNNVTYTYDTSTTSTTKGMLKEISMTGPLATYTETFGYDGFNRVSSRRWSRDGLSYETGYQYNGANQVTRITYPVSGRAVTYSHDNIGKLSWVADQYSTYLSGTTYNVAGQVADRTYGNGVAESFGYDAQRMQMTSQRATAPGGPAGGLMNLTYGYQAQAGQSGADTTAGNTGQLMTISGQVGGLTESAAYTYDLQGRIATSNQTTNAVSAQRRFAYDRWGNRTGMWDATSSGNQIQSISLQQSGGAPTNRIQSVTSGRINVASATNGAVASASSTLDSRFPASGAINGDRRGTNWESGGGWHDATYNSYPDWIQVDFNGSKAIDEIDVFTLQDNYLNPEEPTESMTFSQWGIVNFDVQYWNGSAWVNVPGGSVTGNDKVWRRFSFPQVTTSKIRVNVSGALGAHSRVTEIEAYQVAGGQSNYTYDAAGNVTNDGAHSYEYDAENRLTRVDGGVTAVYMYDYANRRIKKVSGSMNTNYVWDGNQVISEHEGAAGAVIASYVYAGGQVISKVSGDAVRYLLSDRLSVRLTLDSNGNVIGRQGHLPFGEEIGVSWDQDKRRFTSYERDSESGTDYAINRQYAQSVGRFMRVDPVAGSIADPQSLNRYAYSRNDPINRTDPLGLDSTGPIQYRYRCQDYLRIEYYVTPSGNILIGHSYIINRCVLVATARDMRDPRQVRKDPPSQAGTEQIRKDFKDFLNNMSKDCQTALQSYMSQLSSAADTVKFYDLDLGYPDGQLFGNQQAFWYLNPDAVQGYETLYQWFSRRHNNQTANKATAAFDAPFPGIYYRGSETEFIGGNMYLLLHEMTHMVSKKSDQGLAREFGITVGANETASEAVSRWFNNGCK